MNRKQAILFLLITIFVFLLLSFHIVFIGKLNLVPKENLTFKNTFIFDSDVSKHIERYNRSNQFERKIMKEDVLHKLLESEGLIYKSESYPESKKESVSENKSSDLIDKTIVIVNKANIYKSANYSDVSKSYLILGDEIEIIYKDNGFVNFRFFNYENKEIRGWIKESDVN